MNPLKRLRYWLAKPLLGQLAYLHAQDIVNNCQLSYDHGFKVGLALGQLQGQQQMLAQLAQVHNPEPSPEEIETTRIGLIH